MAVLLINGTAMAADSPAAPVHERYGDWEVVCATVGKATACSVVQQQGTKAAAGPGGIQRVIAMELMAVPEGAVGTLLTPFGVDLGKGVVLKLDKAGPPLPFRTCLPTGCLVPLQFGKEAIRALQQEQVLRVSFATAGDGRQVDLTVSLSGLGQALDRAKALGAANRAPS